MGGIIGVSVRKSLSESLFMETYTNWWPDLCLDLDNIDWEGIIENYTYARKKNHTYSEYGILCIDYVEKIVWTDNGYFNPNRGIIDSQGVLEAIQKCISRGDEVIITDMRGNTLPSTEEIVKDISITRDLDDLDKWFKYPNLAYFTLNRKDWVVHKEQQKCKRFTKTKITSIVGW